jgi:hypothetical protein
MTLGHVRAWPVPFNDGCAVASMNMSTEYEVILLTSEGPKVRCKWGGWDGTAEQAAEKVAVASRKRPSAAKARTDFRLVTYGLKAVPFKNWFFSAACESRDFQDRVLTQALKAQKFP